MATERLGIGIVGTGAVAREHVQALKAVDGVSVLAVHDMDQRRAVDAAQHWGANVADSLEELTRDPAIGAVIVATPPHAHLQPVLSALAAGKHVLCEKPLSGDLSDAEAIALAAARSTAWFACCSGRLRHVEAHREAVRLRDQGVLGEVYHVRYSLSMTRRRPGHHVLPAASWFLDRGRAGGGALLDLGVYAVDAALALLGHPLVRSVLAQTYTFSDHPPPPGVSQDVEDHGVLMLQCADGKSAFIEAAWLSNMTPTARVEVLGTRAGLRLDPLTMVTASRESEGAVAIEQALINDPERGPLGSQTIRLATRDFVAAIREGRQPISAADEALLVARVMAAAYQSAAQGAPVTLSSGVTS